MNLRGTFFCICAAGRHFADRGRQGSHGSLELCLHGRAAFTSYCASKTSVVSLTQAAVQVKAVAPGYVETDTNGTVGVDEKPNRGIVGQTPVRRMGRAEEFGPPVVYLASAASDFITGERLVFDGGRVAR